MLEMSFAIPFLVLVGFGGLEIANLTLAHTRVSQLGLNTADNAARIAAGSNLTQPQVREVDINGVFVGAERRAEGLDLENNGRIILSSLQRNDDGGSTEARRGGQECDSTCRDRWSRYTYKQNKRQKHINH